MAHVVAALGVPHTPTFPSAVAVDDPADETARLFAGLAARLRSARVDTIVMFDSVPPADAGLRCAGQPSLAQRRRLSLAGTAGVFTPATPDPPPVATPAELRPATR